MNAVERIQIRMLSADLRRAAVLVCSEPFAAQRAMLRAAEILADLVPRGSASRHRAGPGLAATRPRARAKASRR